MWLHLVIVFFREVQVKVDPEGLGTHFSVKVPRPGDSEGTLSVFESSYHLLLPV